MRMKDCDMPYCPRMCKEGRKYCSGCSARERYWDNVPNARVRMVRWKGIVILAHSRMDAWCPDENAKSSNGKTRGRGASSRSRHREHRA